MASRKSIRKAGRRGQPIGGTEAGVGVRAAGGGAKRLVLANKANRGGGSKRG